MRREWIEMPEVSDHQCRHCTSPSMRREWIEILVLIALIVAAMSPSMRREWIEMSTFPGMKRWTLVSLHAEGVD